jgi:hypothetical protein
MERDINLSFEAGGLPVDRDAVVAGVDARPELLHRLAVNGNSAGENECFARSAGCHSGIRKEFLQADHLSRACEY